MVIAVTDEAHRHLNRQFEAREVLKEYTALLEGEVELTAGEIRLPFRLDPDNRPYQIHDPVHGKMGISRWRRLRHEAGRTRVLFMPLTGRTHQLRLHAAHRLGLGCPIVGDSLYGSGHDGEQMMLHASSLTFTHPVTGQGLSFFSRPPF
jgi:tRNA pseudouridine32 synthase/23S rRNA pseudouridine746 synthase